MRLRLGGPGTTTQQTGRGYPSQSPGRGDPPINGSNGTGALPPEIQTGNPCVAQRLPLGLFFPEMRENNLHRGVSRKTFIRFCETQIAATVKGFHSGGAGGVMMMMKSDDDEEVPFLYSQGGMRPHPDL